MAVAIQSLSCARFATRSFPSQRKPLLFSVTLSSRSRNLYSSIVTASSKKKNKKKKSSNYTASSKNNNNNNNKKEKASHATKGNDKEEDAFEMLFKQFEEVLKTDDLSKDSDGDDHITEEEIALFERELEGVLGELEGMLGGFDAESLNSDTGETQTDNDAEKNSGNGNENSLFGRELDGMLGEFEGLLGELEGALGEIDAELLNSDSSETQTDNDAEKSSGNGNEKSLFEREFDAELLNSDTSETQVVNDAKKSSSDGNENSPKLRTSKLNKLVRSFKTRRRKTSEDLSHVTEGNDKKEDAFEMLLKQLEEALKNDLSKDDSGDDNITEEEITLFERKVEDLLGDFDAGLLNSDSSETQAGDNDDEKNSGDGYDNSPKLRTWLSSISFSLFGECF